MRRTASLVATVATLGVALVATLLVGCGAAQRADRAVLASASTSASASASTSVSRATAARMPTKAQWLDDVRAALSGSGGWIERRVARGGRHLAIVLDIDNTSIATYYDPYAPVVPTRRLANHGRALGVTTLVATGRPRDRLARPARWLRNGGFHVAELCGRRRGETLAHGKERCRAHFRAEGYTLIAMVGNRPTDFTGSGYGRAWRLPNYDLRLG